MKKKIIPVLLSTLISSSILGNELLSLESNVSPAPSQVLILLSASNFVTTKEGKQHRTGYFLSELALPALALQKAGFKLIIATPGGKPAHLDPVSDNARWFSSSESYGAAKQFMATSLELQRPIAIDELSEEMLQNYLGVFVPGGHAPLEDLAQNIHVGSLLNHFHRNSKPTALICHGPAALLSARNKESWIYDGYKMTAFSTKEEKEEEDAGHLDGHMQFYLDAKLQSFGGQIDIGPAWTSKVIKDRELITGQNPMSEAEFTAKMLEALVQQRIKTNPP